MKISTPLPAPAFLRRDFVKTSALAAAALTLPRFNIGRERAPVNGKIHVACIGIGNRGWFGVSELMKDPRTHIAAVCDVNRRLAQDTFDKAADLRTSFSLDCADVASVPFFSDYREMFATMSDQFDAVLIAAPDHHHYAATILRFSAANMSIWRNR